MSIPGSASPLFLSAAAAEEAAAGPIKSLRFNADDSARLSKTFGSGGNRKTWTWSGWFKRHKSESMTNMLFACYVNSSNRFYIGIQGGSDKLLMFGRVGGSDSLEILSNQVFRDFGAWYHMVVAIDSTQGSSGNRVKVYVNGTQISLATTTALAQNGQPYLNAAVEHHLGFLNGGSKLNAYMADVYFIDGSQLDATSFGAFDDNGVWQAAEYTGTYGTTGFHMLDFANESTVGHDSSGNNNDFTANNLTTTAPTSYSGTSSITVNNSRTDSVGSLAAVFNGTQDANSSNAYGFLSGAMDFTWSPNTAISYSSKVRVWTGFANGNVFLNGGSAVGTNNNNWTTLVSGSSGTITSIRFTVNTGGGWWAGLEVDDVVLVDGNPADLDVLLDVPANGDSSDDTGAGGEVSGNYATLLDQYVTDKTRLTVSNGNLDVEFNNGSSSSSALSSIAVSSGKYYCEFTVEQTGSYYAFVGIASISINDVGSLGYGDTYAYQSNTGNKVSGGSGSSYGATYTAGDIIGVALDMDAGTLIFYKNGSSQGTAYTSISGTYTIGCTGFDNWIFNANFGQRAFAYSAPSGYKALCTTNLPTPTIADGSDYFDILLWTGNNATSRTFTGLNFAPDFIWHSARSISWGGGLVDAVRGVGSGGPTLRPFNTAAEETVNNFSVVSALTSDGFTVSKGSHGSYPSAYLNQSSATYVAWIWDAGSSTASNTDGGRTASVRANQSAGFSICAYSGGGGTSSFGHGLSAAPEFVIVKNRTQASQHWVIYHKSIGADQFLKFTNDAKVDYPIWQDNHPTSSIVYLGNDDSTNKSGEDYIAYCISPVAGYSAVGSYEGNGSADGPFVYCGFKPRWIIMKNADTGGTYYDWRIIDADRHTYNHGGNEDIPPTLFANASDQERDWDNVDILSNGFKIKDSSASLNQNGATQVFIAFAENPFQANGGLAR